MIRLSLLTLSALAPGTPIEVKTREIDPQVRAQRMAYKEERPGLRGFRANVLDHAHDAWPMVLPTDAPGTGGGTRITAAADIVAKRLARDGLLLTLAEVVETLGPERFAASDDMQLLRSVGLPVDLLAFFTAPAPPSLVRWIAKRVASGEKALDMKVDLESLPFVFQPTLPGFQVATESGENAIDSLRMQIGSGTYYAGEGDGGMIDVVRQLAKLLPDVQIQASIEAKHLEPFRALAAGWKFERAKPLTLLVESLPVAEWAQDNGKPGIVTTDGVRTVATLVPRYASRGEVGAAFAPGETFALEGFAANGQRVAQSPLLFQGGDLLPLRDPKTGMRQMIVGEAELWRNTALGLTRAQVLDAFRAEFAVERCIVLPAVSFHVDYEVCIRATETELIAFVNDTAGAARLIVGCGIGALERTGDISAANAKVVREQLAANHVEPVLQIVTEAIAKYAHGPGLYAESFAKSFAVGASDSGVGNLQRFLLALDTLQAGAIGAAKREDLDIDAHAFSYLSSFRRREQERHVVTEALIRQGFRVVPVPSTSEGNRSLNALNGIHVRGTYYMPAYGGLFAELDSAAQRIFEGTLKDVRVVPVLCGESERREGALHCAVSILPKL